MIAVILSGGLGTRLHPLTTDTPKPMLPINGIPHLEYQINLLKSHGFSDIVFSTGYLHSQIKDYFKDGSDHGVTIRYKEDGDTLLGTAGALKNVFDMLDEEEVLVLNGDILTNINLTEMKKRFVKQMNPIMIALATAEDPSQYGVAVLNKLGDKVSEFIEKPTDNKYGNLINAGIYMMLRPVINMIPEGFSMIEKTVFPEYAKAGMLGGYTSDFYWIDIGTHERYVQVQEDARKYF